MDIGVEEQSFDAANSEDGNISDNEEILREGPTAQSVIQQDLPVDFEDGIPEGLGGGKAKIMLKNYVHLKNSILSLSNKLF